MIEIIALILLAKDFGKVAAQKGLKPGIWKLYMVLSWIAGEIVGGIAGIMMFGTDNFFSVELVAIAGAITGYLIIKKSLINKPDMMDDDINQIGNPQL